VRRFWKKPGFLGILTADVGGCTLMDADEFSFVLDIWVCRKLVFWEEFVTVGKNARKPGFLGILTARVDRNRVFMRILRYRAKRWEKTRFMKVLNRRLFC